MSAQAWDTFAANLLTLGVDAVGALIRVTSFCLIVEQIANYCASSALLVIVQAVGTMPLALGGTQELKENFLTNSFKRKL